MSKLRNFAQKNNAISGEREKTVQAGEWMFLPAAAEATRSSEKTIRRYVKKGVIKARRLGKQSNSPLQVWITPALIHTVSEEAVTVDGITEIFDIKPSDLVDFETDDDATEIEASKDNSAKGGPTYTSDIDQQLGQVLKAITQQFADKLDEQKEHIFELRRNLQEKDSQLKLLPDLQKQAETERKTAQERAFEVEALKKQIAALEAEKAESQKKVWWKKLFTP